MSDRAAVALAAAIALGAHFGGGPTPLLGALLVVVAVFARRPWLLGLAAALLAAGLADRARDGLDAVPAGPFGPAWVTLVDDPLPVDSGGVRVDVVADGRRVEALAHGPPAWALERRLAGERVAVTGRLRPPPEHAPWLVVRRVVGRLAVDDVLSHAPAAPLAGGANVVRRTLARGAAGLPRTSRSLLAGVVLGDDREQPPEVADDFRAAGLTHVLVVSGDNARTRGVCVCAVRVARRVTVRSVVLSRVR
jgi:competence protein ComEC